MLLKIRCMQKEKSIRAFMLVLFGVFCFAFLSCGLSSAEEMKSKADEEIFRIVRPEGQTVSERFSPPDGYSRIVDDEKSFSSYLQNFRLLEHGAEVYYYNGKVKPMKVHEAVFDIDVGTKDLQQCADAIIRLYLSF